MLTIYTGKSPRILQMESWQSFNCRKILLSASGLEGICFNPNTAEVPAREAYDYRTVLGEVEGFRILVDNSWPTTRPPVCFCCADSCPRIITSHTRFSLSEWPQCAKLSAQFQESWICRLIVSRLSPSRLRITRSSKLLWLLDRLVRNLLQTTYPTSSFSHWRLMCARQNGSSYGRWRPISVRTCPMHSNAISWALESHVFCSKVYLPHHQHQLWGWLPGMWCYLCCPTLWPWGCRTGHGGCGQAASDSGCFVFQVGLAMCNTCWKALTSPRCVLFLGQFCLWHAVGQSHARSIAGRAKLSSALALWTWAMCSPYFLPRITPWGATGTGGHGVVARTVWKRSKNRIWLEDPKWCPMIMSKSVVGSRCSYCAAAWE